jgi:hypothetical protein
MGQNNKNTSTARDEAGNLKPAHPSGPKASTAGGHREGLEPTDPKKGNKASSQAPYGMNLGPFEAYEPGLGRYRLTESELRHGFSDHDIREEGDKQADRQG